MYVCMYIYIHVICIHYCYQIIWHKWIHNADYKIANKIQEKSGSFQLKTSGRSHCRVSEVLLFSPELSLLICNSWQHSGYTSFCLHKPLWSHVISGSLSPRMARPQVPDGGTASDMEGSCEINWISSRGQPTRGGPPAWGLGEMITTPPRENLC